MHADIIIYNAKCIGTDKKEGISWIAVKDSKIEALGKGATYRAFAKESTILLDAKGKTVLPGFIDSHFQIIQTAMNEESLNLKDTASYDEIGNKIRAMEKNNPRDSIFGVRLDKENLKEKKYPNRHILDKFSQNVPIWINSIDYQVSMLNTYSMLYYKIPFNTEGIQTDSNGVATGIFKGKANAILRKRILDSYPNIKRYKQISNLIPKMLSNGITTINAMEGGYMYSDKDANFIYDFSEEFPIDIALFYQCMDFNKVKEKKLDRIGTLYVDGTIGARTAALSFEYNDSPGNMGRLIFSQEELNEFVAKCYIKRLQLSLHTIGDRAVNMALNAHEYALYHTGIKGLRHRLEHVILVSESQMKRARDLDIIFSMNPTY